MANMSDSEIELVTLTFMNPSADAVTKCDNLSLASTYVIAAL